MTVDVGFESLRIELRELGATQEQRDVLEVDPLRARAAIAQARKAGAEVPVSYALSLYRSATWEPDAPRRHRLVNLHGAIDPTRTDDGERVWQADEVDTTWRKGYLEDCSRALSEGRDPAERYLPSAEEFDQWSDVMGVVGPPGNMSPENLTDSAGRALLGWAIVWGFAADPRADDIDLEPVTNSRI